MKNKEIKSKKGRLGSVPSTYYVQIKYANQLATSDPGFIVKNHFRIFRHGFLISKHVRTGRYGILAPALKAETSIYQFLLFDLSASWFVGEFVGALVCRRVVHKAFCSRGPA